MPTTRLRLWSWYKLGISGSGDELTIKQWQSSFSVGNRGIYRIVVCLGTDVPTSDPNSNHVFRGARLQVPVFDAELSILKWPL